jgi:outer membrane protein
MKGIISGAAAVMCSVFLFGATGWAQTRIATVKVGKIFDGYWKTKQADAALHERQADLDKDMKEMVSDYNNAKDEYQTLMKDANDQVISAAEREKRTHAAEDKLKQMKDMEDNINKYQRSAGVQLEEQAKRMKENILVEIRSAAKARAEAAGYALVINTDADAANGAPVVLYTNNENDITDSVLQQLNSTAPLEPPKSDDAASGSKAGKKK